MWEYVPSTDLRRSTEFSFVRTAWPRTKVLPPNIQKAFWSCICKIQKLENRLACVMGLRYAREQVILVIILRKKSPNMNGWKSIQRRGSGIFSQSEKPQVNIPRKVKPWWYARSNWSGYFYNASQQIWRTCFQEWIILFRKNLALSFIYK